MMNVMRTLINLQLKTGWNTWYFATSDRRQIEETRVLVTEKTHLGRCHRAMRIWFEATIDVVVVEAAALRMGFKSTVQCWFEWRKSYFREIHGIDYMHDVTKGLQNMLRKEEEVLKVNMSRASIGANRILPKAQYNLALINAVLTPF